MSYKLIIVESPAKCTKIEKFLGAGYKVLGSYGHITHLSNLKQIDFANNYKPNFEIVESKQMQINKIKRAINNASETILATDDDREGEAIAWHICQVFNLPIENTKRIIFHEITEGAIKNAITNPTIINMNLVYAQQGRQILDLIVGFKITPLLWKYIVANTKNSLSAGRCQTPALRLVYDNYKEIIESPGKMSFNSSAYFTPQNILFSLNYNHNSHEEIKEFLTLSKTHDHILSKEKEKEIQKIPPQPFTTSSLQQSANNIMHCSPKETMALAQKLYEGGYITYMRTDSKVYSEEFIEKSKEYITAKYNSNYINKELYKITQSLKCEEDKKERTKEETKTKKEEKAKNKNSKKGDTNNDQSLAQEAHEAIRPTNINVDKIPDDEDVFTAKHRKLYKLIWTNTLESMMAISLYKQLVVKISAPENKYYRYSAEENIFLGWKVVQGIEEEKYYNYLQLIKEGTIDYKKIVSKQTLKDLKSHYSEAKLVQLLEQRGIGRPSTFSTLIEKIQERKYVEKQNVNGKKIEIIDYILENNKENNKQNNKEIQEIKGSKEFGNEKNKLVITQTGIFVIEFLLKHFNSLFDYDYTRNMENDLDLIARGEKLYYNLCEECDKNIDELCEKNELHKNAANKDNISEKVNIKIDSKHTYLIGKNGPTIKFVKEDTSIGFYGVKKDIDLEKLKNGHYKLEEIIETKEDNNKLLGQYNNNPLYLKYGKYGYYLECGEIKKSLNSVKINIPLKNIEYDDAINIINSASESNNSLVRFINKDISIRKGKYGDYIFYKTEKMKKPQFLKLSSFNDDYKNCSLENLKTWLKETYQIF
jgi:DNA topoisomerase I